MITIRVILEMFFALHATIAGHVTTLTWTQPRAAQVCVYGERLIFCGEYAPGSHSVRLGECGPCVEHVAGGDVLTLREVGGGSAAVRVAPASVRLAVVRR